MTINEELLHAGFTLRPDDVVRLSESPEMDSFAELIHEAFPSVKAKPMYPGFPKQVMDMDDSEYRLDQMLHYFSTYDMELLTGEPVYHGWLPDVYDLEQIEDDEIRYRAQEIHSGTVGF